VIHEIKKKSKSASSKEEGEDDTSLVRKAAF